MGRFPQDESENKNILEYNGQNPFRTVETSLKNQTALSQQSSKKCHILTIFPVLGKLTHMRPTVLAKI